MNNTFAQAHIDTIQRLLDKSSIPTYIKRSRVYTKAAVIGRPGISGALIVSIDEESSQQPGRACWRLSWVEDSNPKVTADGLSDPTLWETTEVFSWADLMKTVEERFL